jgi:NAD(P)-dependent dehydrogenase (short-subunit alcohol dehydrogenase family)
MLCKAHGNIIPIQGSVNDHDDVQRLVDTITAETGYIDLLVNNAGQTTSESGPNPRAMPSSESSISV